MLVRDRSPFWSSWEDSVSLGGASADISASPLTESPARSTIPTRNEIRSRAAGPSTWSVSLWLLATKGV